MILAAAALTLSLQLQRTSFDVLDGINIEVVAHNPQQRPVNASFATPAEYEIQILRGSDVLWTSLRPQPPGVHFPAHPHAFFPGPNVIAVYIWNGIANDGSTPGPGEYTVRARLLNDGTQPQTSTTVRFVDPVPVAALSKFKEGDEVTITGRLDERQQLLTDQSGSIALMRKIAGAPTGEIAVRGYVLLRSDGSRAFFVKRWAAVGERISPPVSIPSPHARRH